ncbi:MAG: hypothetical protein LBH25_05220 [Fibromonadaceae bacterium]|jgi:hypothetical protein|nr:hypothetical protein [Fibromonadaceae bacterium]
MKLKEIAFLCSIFLAAAWAQDSLSVDSVAVDSVAVDSVVVDSLKANSVAMDSVAVDSLAMDSLAADTSMVKLKKGLNFFIGAGVHFISFKERSRFQAILEAQFNEYKEAYEEDSLGFVPVKQDFQSVNLTFPLSTGLMWHFNDMHSLGLGLAFFYNNESVILTDKHGETHNLKYTLQAFPIFAEYRLQVSPNLISLKNGDYFSIFLRYYWLLPNTEFYSSWGNAKADFEALGSGYGVFMGYRFWEWEGFSFWGEMGLLSLDAKGSNKNAVLSSWNLGGISILLRVMM